MVHHAVSATNVTSLCVLCFLLLIFISNWWAHTFSGFLYKVLSGSGSCCLSFANQRICHYSIACSPARKIYGGDFWLGVIVQIIGEGTTSDSETSDHSERQCLTSGSPKALVKTLVRCWIPSHSPPWVRSCSLESAIIFNFLFAIFHYGNRIFRY